MRVQIRIRNPDGILCGDRSYHLGKNFSMEIIVNEK